MASAWLPGTDSGVLAFVSALSGKVSASPGAYGLSSADAAELSLRLGDFSAALSLSTNPATRTRSAVAVKEVARRALLVTVRSVAKRVVANPAVSLGQKVELGLQVKSGPSPVPPPAGVPAVAFAPVRMGSRRVTVRVRDAEVTGTRAKPYRVAGAEVFVFVGEPANAPAELTDWRFAGHATRGRLTLPFRGEDVGRKATVVARWYNAKGEAGPTDNPITGTIAA